MKSRLKLRKPSVKKSRTLQQEFEESVHKEFDYLTREEIRLEILKWLNPPPKTSKKESTAKKSKKSDKISSKSKLVSLKHSIAISFSET